jgi:hypothetical protein
MFVCKLRLFLWACKTEVAFGIYKPSTRKRLKTAFEIKSIHTNTAVCGTSNAVNSNSTEKIRRHAQHIVLVTEFCTVFQILYSTLNFMWAGIV